MNEEKSESRRAVKLPPYSGLEKVHRANLRLLKEIDRICRKYKISYMLDSGTLLGAVRHEGFIPWDDDVDLAFTRANYEMFLKVAPRELPEGMSLLRPEEIRGARCFMILQRASSMTTAASMRTMSRCSFMREN